MFLLHSSLVVGFLIVVGSYAQEQQQQSSPFPVRLNTTVIRGSNGCPTQQVLDAQLDLIRNEVQDSLNNIVTPYLACPCGGPGNWNKIADLDMTDPNQQCPSNWNLNEPSGSDIRGCGRTTDVACDSNFYPSNGRTYSHVCGRIIAYQKGPTNAFGPQIFGGSGLNTPYVDGISITHGSRTHIWSFGSANRESILTDYPVTSYCTSVSNPNTVASIVGDNYFCDTGNDEDETESGRYYLDDPLFDGQGCSPGNIYCQFNNPPWFCTQLPEPTSDDLEIRICSNNAITQEDVVISMIDVYIR